MARRVGITTTIPVEAVFAAGDIIHEDPKLKYIAPACAQAAVATNCAKAYIDPEAGVVPTRSAPKRLKETGKEITPPPE